VFFIFQNSDIRRANRVTFYIFPLLNVSYNIFRKMNMKKNPLQPISVLLETIAPLTRLQILLAVGTGEACVCHLETALGLRQAYISQHLMALRKADILQDRREGRYIFYRLKDPSLLDLITASAALSGIPAKTISAFINTRINPSCECPQCVPALIPAASL
jgi:ArsR family transcriptional regulator